MRALERGFQMGDRLRELRRERALTQDELAELSGVHKITISDIERRATKAAPKTLRKLAAALEVDVREFTRPES